MRPHPYDSASILRTLGSYNTISHLAPSCPLTTKQPSFHHNEVRHRSKHLSQIHQQTPLHLRHSLEKRLHNHPRPQSPRRRLRCNRHCKPAAPLPRGPRRRSAPGCLRVRHDQARRPLCSDEVHCAGGTGLIIDSL